MSRRLPAALLALLASSLLVACGNPTPQATAPPPVVSFIVITPQRAELAVELPGRTVAWRIAQVRPQISGIIRKRLYTEGAMVAAGQPLYQIEPGVYQATRDSAQAALRKAEATVRIAELRHTRIDTIAASGLASAQDRDDATADLQQAEADLGIARAALASAEINLSYTRITAPISGRIATSAFTEGALVTANQTAELTTIQQLDPIYVDMSQASTELLRPERKPGEATTVQILLEDGSRYPLEGRLEFTGVTVSEGTGAVTLRARVPNPKHQLLPGMYVRARVQQARIDAAILAPQGIVARDENGEPYALVLTSADRVERRSLKIANAVGDQWLVTEGLAAGDRLITDGRHKLRPGDLVQPVPTPAAGS